MLIQKIDASNYINSFKLRILGNSFRAPFVIQTKIVNLNMSNKWINI